MADPEFARFKALYIESAAYHEAGHVTAAAVQEMPLQDGGVHVDSEGSGISYYWDRSPGDLGNSKDDQLERERTIIAIFAGWAAQRRFLPDCSEDDWEADRAKVRALLDEAIADLRIRRAIEAQLWEKAQELVVQHWPAIEALASTLLARPYTHQPPIEISATWSKAASRIEKRMSGAEVAELLSKFQIQARIASDPTEREGIPRR